MTPITRVAQNGQIHKQKIEWWWPEIRGGRNGEVSVLKSLEFQLGTMKTKSQELDGGDSRTAMQADNGTKRFT
jgi:hypothetical protein